MAIFTPSFVLGLIVLFYLLSFVLFAVIRIATGVSIQRVGYLSLRRIAYTPRDGIRIDIRGLGLHLHRPNFARPTWVSLRFTDLKVTVDFKALSGNPTTVDSNDSRKRGGAGVPTSAQDTAHDGSSQSSQGFGIEPRSRTWKRLTQLKERIKALHGQINWLRMVDVELLNSSVAAVDVGSIQLGSLTMAVDTRRRTVDRGRLFRHKKIGPREQQPAEWILTFKGILFTAEGKDSLEVVDICSLNVHGLLFKDLAGLRDASVSLKLGRIHVPYDDILRCATRIQKIQHLYTEFPPEKSTREFAFADVILEPEVPAGREEKIVQTVSDSREFVASLLRGVQEIQFAISFIGLSKEVSNTNPAGPPLYLNFAMNEFGIDLFRLDPRSPAHRQYFSRDDIAHQALLAAISIGVSVDDGNGKPERFLYVPMATTTVKTTLPSKSIAVVGDGNVAERNANILFANLVITSPSIDLDLKHLPIMLTLINHMRKGSNSPRSLNHRRHLISRLLPKANVKISVQEPVARAVLPPSNSALQLSDEYDLLISSISSISLELESSHSSAGESQYALTSHLRISSQHLYYQVASGHRHDLLVNDALELRLQITANPNVSVIAFGNLETFSVHMVTPEISDGVRQIIKQFRKNTTSTPAKDNSVPMYSFLRRLPSWLAHVQFKGSNFGIEIAGVDSNVSSNVRGLALQLDDWTMDYKIQKNAGLAMNRNIHRTLSNPPSSDEAFHTVANSKKENVANCVSSDGRRLAMNVRGFKGYVVEGQGKWEQEPFVSVPNLELSASTSSDTQGFLSNINCQVKAIYLRYSLARYYTAVIAQAVVQRALGRDGKYPEQKEKGIESKLGPNVKSTSIESMNLDMKIGFLQVKAAMPSDPAVMLQLHAIEVRNHRWASPYLKCQLLGLFASAPSTRHAWSRVVTIKSARIDLRESRRKVAQSYVTEKSVDISTDITKLAVPHQLVLHRIFDNFANIVKATKQLNWRFNDDTNDHYVKKSPEKPRRVPKISFRSRTLCFDLEDGAFEWKLGLIYRVGLNEQKQRLAREEAFNVKMKKLGANDQKRDSSRLRPQVATHGRRESSKLAKTTTSSEKPGDGETSAFPQFSSQPDHLGRQMRYDLKAVTGLTGNAKVTVTEAWQTLQRHNAASWRKRIAAAMENQSHRTRNTQGSFGAEEESRGDPNNLETILTTSERPGLMSTWISDLHIIIDKPSFEMEDYPQYLYKVGKGIPPKTQYSLLIPMSIQLSMGEAKVTLRDYPLPLLHVPAMRPGQSSRIPSWSLKTDFVIAEEHCDEESLKSVRVEVIPPERSDQIPQSTPGFFLNVKRTVSPVKTYSDVDVSINTKNPTSITWGTSYQPAIQDMMQIIENFTKPQIDPSERVGFWDKIRLVFHSRVRVAWRGDGDVHLKLKGSRDPYKITGHGAGFMMCFRDNVRWDIHQDDDPKKFMTVSCGEYVLAIPDYSSQARINAHDVTSSNAQGASDHHYNQRDALFQKVVMKLSGNVRWLAGLVFERDLDHSGRSFEFLPHYNVTLKNPKYAKAPAGQVYDAFRGFRSQHIHLSIAVITPVDRDWSVTNSTPSSSYNSIHMSPRFFTHFFDWWSLFSGVMALPIRQGKLFPGIAKSNKKFGRHLATIKYNLLLSPLFIAHIYKHKDVEDYAKDTVGATGLKLRIDSFILDLHQRREEFSAQGNGRLKMTKTSGMRINKAQLDFIAADIRAVSASISGTSIESLKRATDEELASFRDQAFVSPDLSKFKIPDHDMMWIDMDDFVELDWILPAETHPETKIMPLAFAPRFSYFRQTDYQGLVSGELARKSQFGDEPTHFCIMSQDNDPHRVQCDLINDRISVLNDQLEVHRQTLEKLASSLAHEDADKQNLSDKIASLQEQVGSIENDKSFLKQMLNELIAGKSASSSGPEHADQGGQTGPDGVPKVESFTSDFNNRFIVHNIRLKWNNSLRNIILRYVHQVSQRRGFVYYMSRRAVKFILDIIEEQQRCKVHPEKSHHHTPTGQPSPSMSFKDDESNLDLEERIRELLNDGKSFVNANDPNESTKPTRHASADIRKDISEEFTAQNSYHVRLIAPQIQLQSEKNPTSVLLVTGKAMELKVVQIMDKHRLADDVSGLVQRRFSVDMDGVQFFITNQKTLSKFAHLYTANRYGSPEDSAWPPWVPLESNFDYQMRPLGWFRVVQKTSACLRYDKYNTLRLKYNDEVNKGQSEGSDTMDDAESRLDHLWVEFPQIRAICDSAQYYAMYIIVLDLLLYNEPLEKSRSERLEKIMLAADFSDLTGAPEMVISLQGRIRQLEEIKGYFQLHANHLDRQGWQDRLLVESELASCEDELFFIMKAITTAQRKHDDRSQAQNNGLLRWYLSASEIVWHLMRENNEPLTEIQLKNAVYDRTDNSDGSNYNTMEIQSIHGLNLLPDALYPEMIAPYFEGNQTITDPMDSKIKMFKVQWYMLEAIAGIPVLDQFEVNLFPLKIQLEREVGKKLFEYIFPENTETHSPFAPSSNRIARVGEEVEIEAPKIMPPSSPSMVANSTISPPATRPGSIELRLRPTLTLSDGPVHAQRPSAGTPKSSFLSTASDSHLFKVFQQSRTASKSQTSLHLPRSEGVRQSRDSLQALSRPTPDTSYSNLSNMSGSDKPRRFGLTRSTSKDSSEKGPDDLTEMMSRASNYMTLAYVKIPSVVLCLSYKGRSERNIEDVHNFVFRMPSLEYRNKTWSNLDLALRLKKDVIKALISHTGAIIGNKFSHHRPNKHQQSRLREVANSAALLLDTNGFTNKSTNSKNTSQETSSQSLLESDQNSLIHSPLNDPSGRSFSDVSSLYSDRAKNFSTDPVETTPDTSSAVSSEQEDATLEINQSLFSNSHRARSEGANQSESNKGDRKGGDEPRSRHSTVSKISKRILNTLN